jgi:hypothetical protein
MGDAIKGKLPRLDTGILVRCRVGGRRCRGEGVLPLLAVDPHAPEPFGAPVDVALVVSQAPLSPGCVLGPDQLDIIVVIGLNIPDALHIAILLEDAELDGIPQRAGGLVESGVKEDMPL